MLIQSIPGPKILLTRVDTQNNLGPEFKPYVTRKPELSVLDGCVLWGSCVVIPPKGKTQVLDELHDSHTGISKMKMLACAYVWWPNLDSDIEHLAKGCTYCQVVSAAPPKVPIHPWEWPAQPWSRLHLDFAGPFSGHMYLILVDAYSKWLTIEIMQTITAEKIIQKFCTVFTTHGIPHKIVTDNGPTFRSKQFKTFIMHNSIKHIFSAPYHPSSNSLAERAVQTVKKRLRQMQGSESIYPRQTVKILIQIQDYTTRNHWTGIPPCELLMYRKIRSRLDLVHPDTIVSKRVDHKQSQMATNHHAMRPTRELKIGDTVFAEDFKTEMD